MREISGEKTDKKIEKHAMSEVFREKIVLKAAILSAIAHAVFIYSMFGFTLN